METRAENSFVRDDKESNIDMQIGARLRNLRLLQGMSQNRLGQMIGVSFQQVQKYEKGINRLNAKRLVQLASIFKVPVQAFFGDDEGAQLPVFMQRNDLAILDYLPRMRDDDKEFLALFIRFIVRHRTRAHL